MIMILQVSKKFLGNLSDILFLFFFQAILTESRFNFNGIQFLRSRKIDDLNWKHYWKNYWIYRIIP